MIREGVTSSPLYWPTGWQRFSVGNPARSNFRNSNAFRESQEVLQELGRMDVPSWNVIISTNLRLRGDGIPYAKQTTPTDAGAAVWFTLDGEERVLACDRWDRVEHNLRAIALHIDAMRGQGRWGVGSLEQAFAGFKALPAKSENWWDILECLPGATIEIVKAQHRRLSLDHHPDRGGDVDRFHEITRARDEALESLQ